MGSGFEPQVPHQHKHQVSTATGLTDTSHCTSQSSNASSNGGSFAVLFALPEHAGGGFAGDLRGDRQVLTFMAFGLHRSL
ncbi:MAG TPA: hypothetical protein DEH11_12965 [Actinobacteria bacterium]|nr:hypothetical protein [Actinomycetota bacterium]